VQRYYIAIAVYECSASFSQKFLHESCGHFGHGHFGQNRFCIVKINHYKINIYIYYYSEQNDRIRKMKMTILTLTTLTTFLRNTGSTSH